jgi:2-amino-4-hydroxy-6-hydroxymethyldihydropteridine diphosphokinase
VRRTPELLNPMALPAVYRAAIALGSNLSSEYGDPAANVWRAVEELRGVGEVTAVSSFFETEPVGYTDQPRFVNAAVVLETDLPPQPLLEHLLEIECRLGRDRSAAAIPKGPRVIDLDLLLVDGLVIETPTLTLPHPEMHRRRFVLEPLAKIAPGWVHPMTGLTIVEMLAALGPKP